nr:RNA polymerase sigma-70 factor [Pedobacter panaciterrae]
MFEPVTKYKELSDVKLFELTKSGDRSAFTEIYDRYFGLLYLHALYRLKSKDEAKDIVQDIFSDLWSGRCTVDPKTNVSNYLYTSTRNRVLNAFSHKNVQSRYHASLDWNENTESFTDHRVRERQLKSIIEKEIDALPPRMKSVFLMSRKANMTYVEIARDLEITEQSVRSHVKNALKILRVKLGVKIYLLISLF